MTTPDSDNPPAPTSVEKKTPRDAAYWAKPVAKLKVSELPAGAMNLNVEGRQVVGPLQGFGQMWQKTYRIRLDGAALEPPQIIREWKGNFPSFWPKDHHFYPSLTGIKPGEVAVINLPGPGGMPLSTGIVVIYADDESFSFMNPQGHIFAGMITFSSYREGGEVYAQIQVLVRANDPIYEIGCRIGLVHRNEDRFWHHTLKSLAQHFKAEPAEVDQHNLLIDPKIQWAQAGNIWHNAAIRTGLYAPVALVRRIFRR